MKEACLRSGSGPQGTREWVVDDCRLLSNSVQEVPMKTGTSPARLS